MDNNGPAVLHAILEALRPNTTLFGLGIVNFFFRIMYFFGYTVAKILWGLGGRAFFFFFPPSLRRDQQHTGNVSCQR